MEKLHILDECMLPPVTMKNEIKIFIYVSLLEWHYMGLIYHILQNQCYYP